MFLANSETVEKVSKEILGRDAEKNDLTGCATINGLTIMRVMRPPQEPPIYYIEGFSTVSADSCTMQKNEFTYLSCESN